jgi:hypothetical protein
MSYNVENKIILTPRKKQEKNKTKQNQKKKNYLMLVYMIKN